tara:strand:+ start:782 stop:1141 length:360 start_codon:yes stop_codon:yes gene_type:complete
MSDGFEIKGKLIEKFDEVQVSDKFKKREFVIETSTSGSDGTIYTEEVKFQLVQNNCDKLNNANIGDNVDVKFNIKGRRWEKDGKTSWFTNLDAWYVNSVGSATTQAPQQTEDSGDKLPF